MARSSYEAYASQPSPRRRANCIRIVSVIAFVVVTTVLLRSQTSSQSLLLRGRRQFKVVGDEFVLDGRPFRIISGAFHYFRTPHALWRDRLAKMRSGGLNTVETYVPWNLHEPKRGEISFEGDLDLAAFLKMAQDEGLLAIVRPPPYICAEWEFGGLPAWLLQERGIVLRSSDPRFLAASDAFTVRMAKEVAPLLYSRGGPVIAVQIENEYGSYANDRNYLNHLLRTLRSSGINDCVFFSSNGYWPHMLVNGVGEGVLTTVNFGVRGNVSMALSHARDAMPRGPLFVSEFWDGWFDHWGEKRHTLETPVAASILDSILAANASVNIYMYVGGTNFGLMNGANFDQKTRNIQPTITSYDYDSPISENGDVTDKWLAFRNVISKYAPVPSTPPPPAIVKASYGKIEMSLVSALMDNAVLENISKRVASSGPLSFSQLGLDYGYVLYETTLHTKMSSDLTILGLHDRATIFVDNVNVGTLDRANGGDIQSLKISTKRAGSTLAILVENSGRINFGLALEDDKGILQGVVAQNTLLFNWTMWPLALAKPPVIAQGKATSSTSLPAFFRGSFNIDGSPKDTFLDPTGWGKGIVYINGRNLGRYWPEKGPQVTLFVPAPFLQSGSNEVLLFETEKIPEAKTLDMKNTQNLG